MQHVNCIYLSIKSSKRMMCDSLQWSSSLEYEYLSSRSSISSSHDILSGYFHEGLLTGPTLDNKSITVVWTSLTSCLKLSKQAWLPSRWAIIVASVLLRNNPQNHKILPLYTLYESKHSRLWMKFKFKGLISTRRLELLNNKLTRMLHFHQEAEISLHESEKSSSKSWKSQKDF